MTEVNKSVPLSKGYLIVDNKKCTGCCSCMLACSLAHEGRVSFTLSRIQILDDPFRCFPNDIEIVTCHQCEHPECYLACPFPDEAFCIDSNTGVRYINEEHCTGCGLCREACILTPSRISFNHDKNVAIKCDLCQSTPYWDGRGEKVCIQVCPVKAIKFSTTKPVGHEGYNVNLRGDGWAKLGMSTD